jgi:energy-coupling factor transporter ATP-binding protein EcfA2
MSRIIEEFTIGRNINFASAEDSADKVLEVVSAIDDGVDLSEEGNKHLRNRFWAHRSHTGLFAGEVSSPQLTRLTEKFTKFCDQSKVDAFRWLITRSLWLFVVPNGSNADVNEVARKKGIRFDFFRLILRVLVLLESECRDKRFLYYDELFEILKHDENWTISAEEFYTKVLDLRNSGKLAAVENKLSPLKLEDKLSEEGIDIRRDNINTVFSKSFHNTGLFDQYRLSNGMNVGISISPDLDRELNRRVRFVLDNPIGWDPNEQEWEEYLAYRGEGNDFPFEVAESHQSPPVSTTDSLPPLVERAHEDFRDAGFIVDKQLVRRFITSLLTKPFVILTGLSGSGKTKLAQLFASWLTPGTDARYHEVVAVGADWTSGDDILGYPDALDEKRYVKTPALDLLIRAKENFDSGVPTLPFFLILDEMNLSHVERYFSDFLSALESGEEIELHGDTDDEGKAVTRDGVPGRMEVPPNLFIVGTVNVDETTYTFSPKVLDRANSIEFRTSEAAMDSFLDDPAPIKEETLRGMGGDFAQSFTRSARTDAPTLDDGEADVVKEEMMALFKSLRSDEMGFAFRVGKEISRFIRLHRLLSEEEPAWEVTEAIDAQIVQKILPKFNGSRDKLESPLCSLSVLCTTSRPWRTDGGEDEDDPQRLEELVERARETSGRRSDEYPIQSDGSLRFDIEDARYPLAYEKIVRMLRRLDREGFASFAEA